MSPDLSISATALVCAVGFGVGIFGAVLGSTLFILVPLLSAFGFPIHSAVGTAKVSVVGREVAPLLYFRGRGLVDLKAGGALTLVALATAQVGAFCATMVDPDTLERIVGICMLLMVLVTFINRQAGLGLAETYSDSSPEGGSLAGNLLAGALIGWYTGIFGGGANILIIFALVYISGQTFLNAVANSKLPNLIITAASLPLFISAGYVNWFIAVPLTLSTALGAALGARLAVNRENRTIGMVFRAGIILLAIRYLL